jgi:tyrosinase
MGDLYSSTNDPLFWVHHSGIDRLWYTWQKKSDAKFKDVVASTEPYGKIGKNPKQDRKPGGITSLNSDIYMGIQAPTVRIRTLIDPLNRDGNGFLCYRYDS